MSITAPWPYFVLEICLIAIAGVFARILRQEKGRLNVPLESLRGLLATSVLFHHSVVSYFYFKTGKWTAVPSQFYMFLGTAPVTIFFFLSGFLFWSKCLAHNGVGAYGSFLIARVRRLVPVYYVSLGLILVVVLVNTHFKLVVPLSTIVIELARWLVFVPTFDINGFHQAFFVNAGVIWTLTFEASFYLLLPLLFWIFKGYRIFLYLAVALAVHWMLARRGVVFTFDPHSSGVGPLVALFFDLFFGFGFGLGMFVAFLHARCPKQWWQILQQRRWTPIPLIFLAAPVFLHVGFYTPAEFFLLSVVFLFVAAGNDFYGLLSFPAVFLLGTISYSFYITHGIVLFVLSHLFDRWVPIASLTPLEYWSFVGIVGITTVCLSTLLYWQVERRFMKKSSALSVKTGGVQPVSEVGATQ
jgi:peptidoglycan/LPS O-acetylase OafA/YrhL